MFVFGIQDCKEGYARYGLKELSLSSTKLDNIVRNYINPKKDYSAIEKSIVEEIYVKFKELFDVQLPVIQENENKISRFIHEEESDFLGKKIRIDFTKVEQKEFLKIDVHLYNFSLILNEIESARLVYYYLSDHNYKNINKLDFTNEKRITDFDTNTLKLLLDTNMAYIKDGYIVTSEKYELLISRLKNGFNF